MDSIEIKNIMQSNEYIKKYFKGVYACDRLPQLNKKNIKNPVCLIANTDPINKPGTHWIAIYIPRKGKVEYFDSYGNPPSSKYFINFMHQFKVGYKYYTIQLQSLFSIYCGIYCCEYILHRCRGKSLKSFLSTFSLSTIQNDKKVIRNFQNNFIRGRK